MAWEAYNTSQEIFLLWVCLSRCIETLARSAQDNCWFTYVPEAEKIYCVFQEHLLTYNIHKDFIKGKVVKTKDSKILKVWKSLKNRRKRYVTVFA